MTFAHPAVLVLLLLVPAAAWLAARGERGRLSALARFGEPALLARLSPLPGRRRRPLRHGLRLAGLALAVTALARPQLGEQPATLTRTGRDLLLLLDLSRSMNVADVTPTRLMAAKRAAWEVAAASPGDRVGLVVFGGSAFLQLPLTDDHAALRLFLGAASSDDLGDPATDLSAALAAAAKTFEHEGERGYQAVVLVSDGESVQGDLEPAIARLRKLDVPVFAIGVGTVEGGPVPADTAESAEKYHRDRIGRIVESQLQEGELYRAAVATGGAYARWDPDAGVPALAAQVAQLATRPLTHRRATKRADRFQWPLALAALLLLAEPIVRLRRPDGRTAGRPEGRTAGRSARDAAIAVLALALALATGCSDAHRAVQLYAEGEWRDAYDRFRRALERSGDPALAYNAGNALYRMQRYEPAERQFRDAAGAPALRQRSLYNLGNALLREAEDADESAKDDLIDRAVGAYESALQLEPGDADARWNLEIALRRRGERAGGSSSGRGRNADYGRGNQNVPGYEGNPEAAVGAMAGGGFGSGEGESVEELSESEARRLLDAVQREQLASHDGRRSSRPSSGDKDW
ncbi:MAG TPA: VWA domain-containing protein [Gemmatimonadales bacterium]|nr:VWA domain-containing protein [Gemmatimonadales bacterium]